MKKTYALSAVAALSLLTLNSYGRSEVLLEGFEDNIDNVRPSGEGPRLDNITLSQFTKTDAAEPWVTEGTKALKVEFLNDAMNWGVDFYIQLDSAAGDLLEAAWNGNPETGEKPQGRYVLRYDVTFPAAGTVAWMNHNVNNHWEASREWNSPGNDQTPVTVDVELDLANGTLTRNEDGTVDLRFIDNSSWAAGGGLIPTLYIDNIRLVDQWANETPPTVTVVESFESSIDIATPTAAEGGRASVEAYTAADPADINVTHGTNSLKLTLGQPEGWADDVRIDLSGSEYLKGLLALPAEERERYILRMDMVFQEMPAEGWGGGNWGYKFGTSLLPADTARTPSSSSVYSVNLGRANLNPDAPIITLYGNGGYAGEVVTYVDNIRILDTGAETTGGNITITGITANATTKELTITWSAEAGAQYRVHGSTDLRNWSLVRDNYGATGDTGSITVPMADAERYKFFQISRIP